ncbi:MAG: aldehyde dehydrogenase [Candidatus Sericytochromatia bacterium]
MRVLANLIGEHLLPAQSGETLPVWEPATGNAYASLPASGAADLEAALTAGRAAFSAWSQLSLESRSGHLLALAAGLEARQEELAQAESQDTGKPLHLARSVDIPRAIQNLRFFASALLHQQSACHPTASHLNYTLRQPLGTVACISPWNLPLYLLTWKIAPALAAGNTVVAKPSEVTPLTAHLLAEIALETGLPPGVLNLVHGRGADVGALMAAHAEIPALSFTGSTVTGRAIAQAAAPHFKKLSLEMGGKNAALIFADCDFETMLETVLQSSFRNQGQICLCTSRLLIERPLYARFREALLARVQNLRVGDPLEAATDQGAVVSAAHQAKILACLETARQEGAQVLCGGTAVTVPGRCAQGWFVAPTVLEGLGPETRTNREEIFGPVVTLQPFDTEAEALALANAGEYGLATSLWTRDLPRAQRLGSQVRAGLVWINCWMVRDLRTPFGGMGLSGLGREGGDEAFRFFTEPRNICIANG